MSLPYPDPLMSAAPAEPHSPSMFSSILRRRKTTVLGIAGLVVLLTIAITLRETKIYDATASVVVQGPPTTGGQNQVNMATEAAVAGSPAVAQLVIKHEHLKDVTARQLDARLSVHVPVDSQVLQFTYSSPNPRVAQELAEAFAAGYLSFRTGEQTQTTTQAIAAVQKQIDDNARQLALIKEIIPTLNGQPLAVARAKETARQAQITTLQQRLALLNTSTANFGGQLGPAPYPKSPASPRIVVNLVAALFLGLLLGLGVAAAREYADDRIRNREDLETWLASPVLSSIPTRFKGRAAVDLGGLVTLHEPGSIQAEAFRGLRTSLLLETSNIGARSVLVTSADLDQGSTWVAANLAVALAASGKRVILISADLRNPCLGPVFSTEPEASLYDVLARSEDLRDVVHRTSIEGLWLVEGRCSTGYDIRSQLAGAADLVDLISAGDVVREALNVADLVLVCSPSLPAHSESASWARACDGVLLVSDVRTTTHADTARAKELLGRAHATIVGAVLLERGQRRWRRSRTTTISEPAETARVRTGPDLSIRHRVSASESGES
jgi:capsular polysaccharide biosynthesis protein/Mrp family chromosome partitioning ATPase